jgi:hypothetical protein
VTTAATAVTESRTVQMVKQVRAAEVASAVTVVLAAIWV